MDKTIVRLEDRARKIREQIKTFQENCSHPASQVRYKHDADTGNYDGYDIYWTNLWCGRCGKRWTEDGSINPPGATRVRYEENLEESR